MSEAVRLTPTSYVVLGLVRRLEPVTPYELERRTATSIGYFWSFAHSQLYAEPTRLADAGLLAESVEPSGRRRRRYRITPAGTAALDAWLAEASGEPTEVRDLGLLKLFFSTGDEQRRALALEQQRSHQDRHDAYAALRRRVTPDARPWEVRTLDAGLRFEAMMVGFWADVAADAVSPPGRTS